MKKQRMYVSIADRTILSAPDQAASLEVMVNDEELHTLYRQLGQLADADDDAVFEEFALLHFKPLDEINAPYQARLDELYQTIYRCGTATTRQVLEAMDEGISRMEEA